MKNPLIAAFEKRVFTNKTPDLPKFRPGDTVRVYYKIQEGADKDKFRIQPFEGVVLKRKKGTAEATFTVRKIGAGGVGVERVFPYNSTFIDKVEVIAAGVVRRSRLYYLRDLSGKAARIRSRFGGRRSEVSIPGADFQPEEVQPELSAAAQAELEQTKTEQQAPETKND